MPNHALTGNEMRLRSERHDARVGERFARQRILAEQALAADPGPAWALLRELEKCHDNQPARVRRAAAALRRQLSQVSLPVPR